MEPIGCVAALRSGLALVSGWVFPFADLYGKEIFVVVVGESCF